MPPIVIVTAKCAVGLVLKRGVELAGVEIKSDPTVADDAFGPLRKWQRYVSGIQTYVGLVYGGDESYRACGRFGAILAEVVDAAVRRPARCDCRSGHRLKKGVTRKEL